MKVVINNCFGGFSISKEAAEFMAKMGCEIAKAELSEYNAHLNAFNNYKKTGKVDDGYESAKGIWDINIKYDSSPSFHGYGYSKGFNGYERNSPFLVAAVESLKNKASGENADLKVVEIPDGIEYSIEEYDGNEHIAEKHRTWV